MLGVGYVCAAVAGASPGAQMEAGVMDRSDGWVVSQALRLMPSATESIKSRTIVQRYRGNMAGFYQFLLQSSQVLEELLQRIKAGQPG
jgi:hypothetical protein